MSSWSDHCHSPSVVCVFHMGRFRLNRQKQGVLRCAKTLCSTFIVTLLCAFWEIPSVQGKFDESIPQREKIKLPSYLSSKTSKAKLTYTNPSTNQMQWNDQRSNHLTCSVRHQRKNTHTQNPSTNQAQWKDQRSKNNNRKGETELSKLISTAMNTSCTGHG